MKAATLSKHLQAMETTAVQLKYLLHAINACVDDPARSTICINMIEAALEAADDLAKGLDSAEARFPA